METLHVSMEQNNKWNGIETLQVRMERNDGNTVGQNGQNKETLQICSPGSN